MSIQYADGVTLTADATRVWVGDGTTLREGTEVWYATGPPRNELLPVFRLTRVCFDLGTFQERSFGLRWEGALRIPSHFVRGGGEAWLRIVELTIAEQCKVWISDTETGNPSVAGPRLVPGWELYTAAVELTADGIPFDAVFAGPAREGITDLTEPYSWLPAGLLHSNLLSAWIGRYRGLNTEQKATGRMCFVIGPVAATAVERLGIGVEWPHLAQVVARQSRATERLGMRITWPNLAPAAPEVAATENLGLRIDWPSLTPQLARSAATENLGLRIGWPSLTPQLARGAATENLGLRISWPGLSLLKLFKYAATESMGLRVSWPQLPFRPGDGTQVFRAPTWSVPPSPIEISIPDNREFVVRSFDLQASDDPQADLGLEFSVRPQTRPDDVIDIFINNAGVLVIGVEAAGSRTVRVTVTSRQTRKSASDDITVDARAEAGVLPAPDMVRTAVLPQSVEVASIADVAAPSQVYPGDTVQVTWTIRGEVEDISLTVEDL